MQAPGFIMNGIGGGKPAAGPAIAGIGCAPGGLAAAPLLLAWLPLWRLPRPSAVKADVTPSAILEVKVSPSALSFAACSWSRKVFNSLSCSSILCFKRQYPC
jgi:hypothetical protein